MKEEELDNFPVLDLFCGCGGFSYGFLKAGFKIKWGIDSDKNVKKTYKYNHPKSEMINKDIRDLTPEDFINAKIIIGSPPCKNFSLANRGRDINSGMELVFEFLKWIKKIQPKFWIMENVPQIKPYLKKRIKKFKIPKIVILNSANYGVPQIRRRCFSGKFIKPINTHNKFQIKTLMGNRLRKWKSVEESIDDIKDIQESDIKNHYPPEQTTQMEKRIKNATEGEPIYKNFQQIKRLDRKDPSYTIVCGGVRPAIIHAHYEKNRRITVRECARLQTFPDHFVFFGSRTQQFYQVGNAVPPKLAYLFAKEIRKRIKKDLKIKESSI